MAAAAAEWGVATERIVVHREPLNTAAEARSMAARVKEKYGHPGNVSIPHAPGRNVV